MSREPMYLKMNRETKSGLSKIAKYRHSTIAYLMEEGARLIISKESEKIKEELSNLKNVNQMVNV